MELTPGSVVRTDDGCKLFIKWKDESGPRPVWRQKAKRLSGVGVREGRKRLAEWRAEVMAELEAAERKQRAAARASREAAEGEAVRDTPTPDYVDAFVDDMERAAAVEKSTIRDYRLCARHIRQGLDGVAIGDLTAEDVRRWEARMTGGGMSSSSVIKAHRLLKRVLNEAVALGYITRSPMAAVKPPKRKTYRPNALDLDGRTELVRRLEAEGLNRLTVAAYMALYGGLRVGEACGLRWRDVRLDTDASGTASGGTLWVRGSIGVGENGTYTKAAKTDRVRDVPLTPDLARVLAAWRAVRAAECVRDGVSLGASYVVGDSKGYTDPRAVSHAWHELMKGWGIEGTEGRVCTFHDLRHTFATAAISAGVDVKTVSSIMGHANAYMTLNVYASADPDAKRGAAAILSQAMTRRPAEVATLAPRTGTEG